MSEQASPRSNFELQQNFLDSEQARISGELFEAGVTARVMGDDTAKRGAVVDLKGLGQLEKDFVPSYSLVQDGEHTERLLQLTAITHGESTTGARSRSFTYRTVGHVDNTGTLFPYPEIDPADAEAVHQAAQQLEALRDDGTMPNLRYDLLAIENPRTGIMNASGTARQ